jgi:hypothetical protein
MFREKRSGDAIIPTQSSDRPKEMWIFELGYSDGTRFTDEVMEKKHAEPSNLLVPVGQDIKLLQLVMRSSVTL